MKRVTVRVDPPYDVVVGPGALSELGALLAGRRRIAVVSQAAVAEHHAGAVRTRAPNSELFLIGDGEAAKTYLQVPILHGAATFWAVENFAAPVVEGKGEKVVGAMEKGNVDDLKATWRFRAVDDKHSIVSLDLYLAPKLPVSDALVSEEERDAAADAVRGIKTHAETMKP